MKVTRTLAEAYLAGGAGRTAEAAAVRRQLASKKNLTIEVPDAWVAKTASAAVLKARANPTNGFDAAPARALSQDWGRDRDS